MATHDNLLAGGTRLRKFILAHSEPRAADELIGLWSDGGMESEDFAQSGESNRLSLPTRNHSTGALPTHPQKDPVGIGFLEHVRREQALAIGIASHSAQPSCHSPSPVNLNATPPPGSENRFRVDPLPDPSQSILASFDPLEWADEPDFEIGFEWLGRTSIPPREMSRHWMVFGETGSGKTRSVVIPLIGALIRYGY